MELILLKNKTKNDLFIKFIESFLVKTIILNSHFYY